jgi:hypothetical protein
VRWQPVSGLNPDVVHWIACFSHLNCLFCGITGNCLDGGVTDLKSQSIFDRPAAQDPSKACFGSKFSKNSLFLRWRPVSQDCFRHQAFQRLSLKQKWNGRAGFAAGGLP